MTSGIFENITSSDLNPAGLYPYRRFPGSWIGDFLATYYLDPTNLSSDVTVILSKSLMTGPALSSYNWTAMGQYNGNASYKNGNNKSIVKEHIAPLLFDLGMMAYQHGRCEGDACRR
jgi:hypothetical protein